MPIRGKFIVLEGIDGCGKTTQVARVQEAIQKHQWPRPAGKTGAVEPWGSARIPPLRGCMVKVLATKEPSTGPVGTFLRENRAHAEAPLDPVTQMLLFSADRREHSQTVIEPALKRGDWVICDRYHLSTVCYLQHKIHDCLESSHENFLKPASLLKETLRFMSRPDATIYIRVPFDVALERMKARGKKLDMFERDRAYLAGVYAKYEEESRRADPNVRQCPSWYPRILTVDGLGTEEAVTARIMAAIASEV